MSRSTTMKTEIARIRAEVERLKEAHKPISHWREVIIGLGENKDDEIAEILAAGDKVIEQHITEPGPRKSDEELSRELGLTGELDRAKAEAEHWRQVTEAELERSRTRIIAHRGIRQEDLPRPQPIYYPDRKHGW
jgi:hypothetical protein